MPTMDSETRVFAYTLPGILEDKDSVLTNNLSTSIMSRHELNILRFTIALVAEFAKSYGITQKQAYNYLVRFKGMAHLNEFYNFLHTQSFEDNVEILAEVCQNNGGQLR